MSEKYKVGDQQQPHFITSTIVKWVDIFTRPEYKDIIIESLKYCQKKKGLIVHAYVIMTNHIHLIVSSQEGYDLRSTMRDFKRHTSIQLINKINQIHESRKDWLLEKFRTAAQGTNRVHQYKVWQDGFHPIELYNPNIMQQKLDYLHDNPVTERMVDEPEEFVYSSARQYGNKPGLIDIDFLY